MQSNDLVSIITTTKNEADVIKNLLASLGEQTFKSKEIILVDNNSTDTTVKIAKRFPVKIFNFGPERSAQRNFGAEKAIGKFLLFLDADMELSPKVVEQCVNAVNSSKKVGGVIIPEESLAKTFWERVKAFERSLYNLEGDNITDAARFFSRKAFTEVGGYDETITGPEDWDLSENIEKRGYKIVRITEVIKHRERINSLFSLVRKKYYYGLKANRYLKKQHLSVFSPKTIYFLRPVFYRNWKRLISHPILTTAMFYVLLLELLFGGLGFLVGKLTDEKR